MARTEGSNPSMDCGVDEDFRFLTRQSEVARNNVTLIHIQLCIGLSTRNPLIPRVRSKLQQQRRTKHGGLFPEILSGSLSRILHMGAHPSHLHSSELNLHVHFV